MAKGKMPPACAFAVSVLADYDLDPDSVPEEAVEAAQQHMATCIRCLSNPRDTTPGKKRKVYQAEASDNSAQEDAQARLFQEKGKEHELHYLQHCSAVWCHSPQH